MKWFVIFLAIYILITSLSAQTVVDCENIHETDNIHSFYEDNPTYIDPFDDTSDWDFSIPEEQGMNSRILKRAVKRLARKKYLNSFIIIRNNTIILEEYFNGSKFNHSNNIHSASKSILSTLIGIAIKKGYITGPSQKISQILPPEFFIGLDSKKRDLTIKDLLTMNSGIKWKEDSTEYKIQNSNSWIKEILSLPFEKNGQKSFNYSTGMSHLLSAVLTHATGVSTCEFAHNELFKYLNITAEHWSRDPQGYFSGGYNLYLTPRELAKFTLLYLNNGMINNLQIISPDWIKLATTAKLSVGSYQYGHLWWLKKIKNYDVIIAWGYGGQFTYIIPELNISVVITTNTRDYAKKFNGKSIISKYIIPAIRDI